MKAVIFPQVWHLYMHIHIVTRKVINIKSVDLNVLSATKYESYKKDIYNAAYDFYGKKCIYTTFEH